MTHSPDLIEALRFVASELTQTGLNAQIIETTAEAKLRSLQALIISSANDVHGLVNQLEQESALPGDLSTPIDDHEAAIASQTDCHGSDCFYEPTGNE